VGPGGIPLRKIILALVLLGSIIFFCLILLAGTVAVLREAAPASSRVGLRALVLEVKRVIVHHMVHRR